MFQPRRFDYKARWQLHKDVCENWTWSWKTPVQLLPSPRLSGETGALQATPGGEMPAHTGTHSLSLSQMQTHRGALSLVAQSHSNESALVSPAAFQITTLNTQHVGCPTHTHTHTILGAQTEPHLPLPFSPHNWYETNMSITHTHTRSLWKHFDKTFNGPPA